MADFEFNPTHDQKWTLRTLLSDVNMLKREQAHLQAKSKERPLSSWEQQRLEQIVDELTALFAEVHSSSGSYSVVADPIPA